jgi:hypothetical protein
MSTPPGDALVGAVSAETIGILARLIGLASTAWPRFSGFALTAVLGMTMPLALFTGHIPGPARSGRDWGGEQ